MAVEILILSGARQGEQLVLEANEFRVGTDPGCEVSFDLRRDPSAKDRAALVRLEDDGWYVRSTGSGELMINQQTIAGPMRLRSGDVVRLSALGPDFSFRMVTHAEVLAGKGDRSSLPERPSGCFAQTGPVPFSGPAPVLPSAKVATPVPVVPEAAPAAPVVAPLAREEAAPAVVPVAAPILPKPRPAAASETPGPPAPSPAPAAGQWGKWAVSGLAACVLLLVVWRVLPPPAPIVLPPPAPIVLPPVEIHFGDQSGDHAKAEKTSPATGEPKPPEPKQEPAKPAPEKTAAEQVRDAVFLLQVERAGRFWPFATCVAVGKDTLLASAREAWQLATWREKHGFKIWAVNSALGIKKEVREIRLHRAFATLADKEGDWIYFNLAVLTVEGDLPKVAPLASLEELGELKEDAPVSCIAITHNGKKTSSDRKFEPQVVEGSICVFTTEKELPTQPRLLHLDANVPPNACGSPVLSEKGRVIGIYGASAPPPAGKQAPPAAGLKDIHYVALVNPQLIRLWTEKRDTEDCAKIWVSPSLVKAPSKPPEESEEP